VASWATLSLSFFICNRTYIWNLQSSSVNVLKLEEEKGGMVPMCYIKIIEEKWKLIESVYSLV
jgi:hypothetical protein